MESECRVPSACCRPRGVCAALLSEESTTVKQQSAPCWLLEDFVVAAECSPCTAFQTTSWASCGPTGFVERVKLHQIQQGRVQELPLVPPGGASLLERLLDRLASEKVRRQIESI
ncbi:hypothetical protein KUCAC02_037118 [Chaenocephalus aceratus]|nr:hypothetical protein KUCAC02_037118 [Chaenocephalus aceratus]